MTMAEIDAIGWARGRHQTPKNDILAEMYDDLQKLLLEAE